MGQKQANRRVYIRNWKDRGFQLPRLRESRDFSPNRFSLDQHIGDQRVVVRYIQGRDDQIELCSIHLRILRVRNGRSSR